MTPRRRHRPIRRPPGARKYREAHQESLTGFVRKSKWRGLPALGCSSARRAGDQRTCVPCRGSWQSPASGRSGPTCWARSRSGSPLRRRGWGCLGRRVYALGLVAGGLMRCCNRSRPRYVLAARCCRPGHATAAGGSRYRAGRSRSLTLSAANPARGTPPVGLTAVIPALPGQFSAVRSACRFLAWLVLLRRLFPLLHSSPRPRGKCCWSGGSLLFVGANGRRGQLGSRSIIHHHARAGSGGAGR